MGYGVVINFYCDRLKMMNNSGSGGIFWRLKSVRFNGCWTILWRYTFFRGSDMSLARPISRCILFDGENISFDASLVIYINSTNIPPIMIVNRIYERQNLLLL